VKVGAIREHAIHVRYPLIRLDFGANGTETTFARVGDVAYLRRMNGAGECSKAEPIGLSAIHHLPNIEGYVPGDHILMCGKKFIPIFPENLFETKRLSIGLDDFHDQDLALLKGGGERGMIISPQSQYGQTLYGFTLTLTFCPKGIMFQ
jgi:hypothetical protein